MTTVPATLAPEVPPVPAPAPAPGAATRARSTEPVSPVNTVLTMVGLVCLWVVLQLLVLGGYAQDRSQHLLYDRFRVDLASATAPLGPDIEPGTAVAQVKVPRLGIDQVVVEGTASGDLLVGPGHRRDTPLPGQAGTSVIYGRAATYGGPFGELTRLSAGETLHTVTAQGEKVWKVLGVRRAGDPLPQPAREGRARLTLVTAVGSAGRLSALRPDGTLYVDAEAKKAFPAPAGRASAVPEPETAMAADRGALPLLVLYLAALVALTLGVLAAVQRWSVVLVWVVATPAVIALAWQTTDVVMRLLPNLI